MNEEQYRAEMAKQARLENLISMRVLSQNSVVFGDKMGVNNLDNQIKRLSGI